MELFATLAFQDPFPMLLNPLIQNGMPAHTMETCHILYPMIIGDYNRPMLDSNRKHIKIN